MDGSERRKYPRFDVSLSLKNFYKNCAGEVTASTRDISSRGLGCVSDNALRVGSLLDMWLYMPDGEAIRLDGLVMWVAREGSRYRMGIELCKEELKPIPIVLRTLTQKVRRYS
jgi:hypothetical protein